MGTSWTCPTGTSVENCQSTDAGSDAPAQACGGKAGYVCPSSEYCDFPDNICGAADGSGECKPRPAACDDNEKPVCACDGKSYTNACQAAAAGFDLSELGACPSPPQGYFSCGAQFCEHGKEFCTRQVPSSACAALPSGCTGNNTCACLQSQPCGTACQQSTEGDLTLTCK